MQNQSASEENSNQKSGQDNVQNYNSGYDQNLGQTINNNPQSADSKGESWPASDNNNQIPNNNQGFSNNTPQFNEPPATVKKSGVLKWVLIILITFVALSIIGLLLFFFLYIPSRPEYRIAKMAENSLTKPAPQASTTFKYNAKSSSASNNAAATIKFNSAMNDGKIQLNVKIEDISKSSEPEFTDNADIGDSSSSNLTSLKGIEASGVYADEQVYFKLSNTEEVIQSLGLDNAESGAFSLKDDQWYSYKLSNLVKDKEELNLATCILSKAGQPLFNKKDLNKYLKVQNFLGLSSQFVFSEEKINGQDMLVATLNKDRVKNVDENLQTEESIQIQKNLIKDSSIGSCFTDQQITDFIKREKDDDNSSSSSDNLDKFVIKIYIDSDNQLKRTDISGDEISILTDYNNDSVNIEAPSGAKALDN